MRDASDLLTLPRTTCRSCGSGDLTELFSLGEQHVSDFPRPGDPLPPRVPITLDLCGGCSLVQQRYTAPQDFLYTRHYWYLSGTTSTMRRALADVVDAAMQRVSLSPGDVVLDIGSNDGTLLRQYPRELGLTTVGVEPADNLLEEGSRGLTHQIHDFWSAESYRAVLGDRRAKVVTACGMFYDLDDPNPFVADVAKALHPDGVFVAQLMCLKQTVERRDVGNFAHEHLEFYSLESLDRLFKRYGLEIRDVEENAVNGGSYRLFVRHKSFLDVNPVEWERVIGAFATEHEMGLDEPFTYHHLFQEMARNRDECVAYLAAQRALDKEIWVYGASTKGNVILQWMGLTRDDVTGAADKSVEKHGREMVGTRIPIFSEELMRRSKPDFCVVLPYAFLQEFVERESGYSWRRDGGKFVVPLPVFKVV